jgi:hypothetical protein
MSTGAHCHVNRIKNQFNLEKLKIKSLENEELGGRNFPSMGLVRWIQ